MQGFFFKKLMNKLYDTILFKNLKP